MNPRCRSPTVAFRAFSILVRLPVDFGFPQADAHPGCWVDDLPGAPVDRQPRLDAPPVLNRYYITVFHRQQNDPSRRCGSSGWDAPAPRQRLARASRIHGSAASKQASQSLRPLVGRPWSPTPTATHFGTPAPSPRCARRLRHFRAVRPAGRSAWRGSHHCWRSPSPSP